MTMEYGEIPGLDKAVSRLVLGSMIVHTKRLEESMALLDSAAACGINAIDTAHVYGGGNSERAIGEWMQHRGNREDVVIISKGCHPNADRRRVTPYDLESDLHDSLARLRTDYIDCYLLHRDDPEQPVAPLVRCFNSLLDQGLIRSYGASNWTHTRIGEANAFARSEDLVGMVASSPHFSLAEQVDDPWGPGCVGISGPGALDARAWYAKNQMAVFPYSSLARGFFSGRVKSTDSPSSLKEGGVVDAACLCGYCHEVNFKRLARAEALAEDLGVTVPQLALAFVLHQDMNIFPLVGAAHRHEIEANVAAMAICLTATQLAWLNLED